MRNTPQGTLIPGHQPMALESPRAGLLFARAARRLAAAAILVGLSTLCFAPAAFAQTQLWTGTLEVQQVNSSIVGCSNGVPTAPCTDITLKLTQRASNNPATGDPTISGTARVGQTLTAAKGTIDDDGLTKADDGDTGYAYTYQWVPAVRAPFVPSASSSGGRLQSRWSAAVGALVSTSMGSLRVHGRGRNL